MLNLRCCTCLSTINQRALAHCHIHFVELLLYFYTVSFDYLRNADTVQHALDLRDSRTVRPWLVQHHAESSSREKAVDEPQPRECSAVALEALSMHEVQRVGGKLGKEGRVGAEKTVTCVVTYAACWMPSKSKPEARWMAIA